MCHRRGFCTVHRVAWLWPAIRRANPTCEPQEHGGCDVTGLRKEQSRWTPQVALEVKTHLPRQET